MNVSKRKLVQMVLISQGHCLIAKVHQFNNIGYPCCGLHIEETFPHKFCECNQARHVWSWALTIVNKLRCNPYYFDPWMR